MERFDSDSRWIVTAGEMGAKSGTVVVLRVRLTVGRLPLEEVIGVRVPDPQLDENKTPRAYATGVLFLARV